MGTRTVRLDDQTERTLQKLRRITGLSISEVLKRGLEVYSEQVLADAATAPYEIFSRIDLGGGGWALAPGRKAKQSAREIIARKHRR